MSIVTLQGVERRFGRTRALDGVDLLIDTPQVVGLVGRNGAGKSTLLRLLPPLLPASAGQVRVFDRDPWTDEEAIRTRLGYVSDQDRFPPYLRADDIFDLCQDCYPSWDPALVERFTSRFALDRRRRLSQLSKGQQRQIALLAGIGHRPELLILDEPAGGLDPVARRELLQVLVELLAEAGSTVLFASHQFGDVNRLAERLVIVHQGRILRDGDLHGLLGGYCRALVPTTSRPPAVPWCLGDNRRIDGLELLLECPMSEAVERLQGVDAAIEVLTIEPIGLEDLFIALTGRDERDAPA